MDLGSHVHPIFSCPTLFPPFPSRLSSSSTVPLLGHPNLWGPYSDYQHCSIEHNLAFSLNRCRVHSRLKHYRADLGPSELLFVINLGLPSPNHTSHCRPSRTSSTRTRFSPPNGPITHLTPSLHPLSPRPLQPNCHDPAPRHHQPQTALSKVVMDMIAFCVTPILSCNTFLPPRSPPHSPLLPQDPCFGRASL